MDFSRAQELYKQAAKMGYSKAQYNLAIMTLKTAVTQTEYRTAAKWLQAAATRNHRAAQYQLAKMYEIGEGVAWDHSMAWMWMKVSADNGFKRAKEGLPVLTDKMGADELKQGEELLRAHKAKKKQGKKKKSSFDWILGEGKSHAGIHENLFPQDNLSPQFATA